MDDFGHAGARQLIRVRAHSVACSIKKPCRERFRPASWLKCKKSTRVQLYLPIADIPVNVFLILAMGAAVGFVSGMFGIGGGFLMTPLLFFVGIAPAVAVASVAS